MIGVSATGGAFGATVVVVVGAVVVVDAVVVVAAVVVVGATVVVVSAAAEVVVLSLVDELQAEAVSISAMDRPSVSRIFIGTLPGLDETTCEPYAPPTTPGAGIDWRLATGDTSPTLSERRRP